MSELGKQCNDAAERARQQVYRDRLVRYLACGQVTGFVEMAEMDRPSAITDFRKPTGKVTLTITLDGIANIDAESPSDRQQYHHGAWPVRNFGANPLPIDD